MFQVKKALGWKCLIATDLKYIICIAIRLVGDLKYRR